MNTPFVEIKNLRRLEHRSLIASFDVSMPGVTVYNCRLQTGRRGVFIAGPGTRAGYATTGYQVFAEFDEDVAADILAVVEARLAADDGNDRNA